MRKTAFLWVFLLLAAPALAWKGTKEISISGALQKTERTTTRAEVRLGYFLSGRQEIEGSVQYDGVFYEGESENTLLYECSYSYNLIEDKLPLFITAGIGRRVRTNSDDSSCFVLSIGGGLKAFIKGDLALRVDYRLRRFFTEPERNRHDLTLGFSYFFKR